MKTAILVLGMHRSGTSAMTGVLEKMGAALPQDLWPPQIDNPKGFFEGRKVVEINEAFLTELKSSYDDTRFMLSITDEIIDKHLPEVKEFIEEEFSYNKIFALKDPRLCITFPLWERALQELNIEIKVILPYRNPLEVARSLKLRNGFSNEKSLLLWTKHILHAERYTRPYARQFINFNNLLSNTTLELEKIGKLTGLNLDDTVLKLIQEIFLDYSLKHHTLDISNVAGDLPQFIQTLVSFVKKDSFPEVTTQSFDNIYNDVKNINYFMHVADVQSNSEILSDLYKKYELQRSNVNNLQRIKDVSFVDDEYYLNQYPDVFTSNLVPEQHYRRHGKQEGRYPNKYCKQQQFETQIISSASEKLYWCKKELEEEKNQVNALKVHLNELEVSNLEQVQKHAEELGAHQSKIEALTQEKIIFEQSKLEQTQKHAEELAAHQSQIEALSQEKIIFEQSKLEQTQKHAEEVAAYQSQIEALSQEKIILEQSESEQTRKHAEELAANQSQIEALKQEKSNLEDNNIQLSKKREILEKLVDQIVCDLACIKEKKYWTYTKPIRSLSKLLKNKTQSY